MNITSFLKIATPPPIRSYKDNFGTIQNLTSTEAITDDTTPEFNVGSLPNEVTNIELYVNGQKIASLYDATSGTLRPKNPLVDGKYDFTYRYITDSYIISSASPKFTLTIDTSPPPSQIISNMHVTDKAGNVKGELNSGDYTDDIHPTLHGNISDVLKTSEVIKIYDGTTYLGNAVVIGKNWSFIDNRTLEDNTNHSYTAVIVSATSIGTVSNNFELHISLASDEALNRISIAAEYNDSTALDNSGLSTPIVIQDYINAGATNIRATTLLLANSILDSYDVEGINVDSTHEVKSLVNAVNKVEDLADGINNDNVLLTNDDLIALGMADTINTEKELTLFNDVLDNALYSNVNTGSNLEIMADIVDRIMKVANQENANIGQIEFERIGIHNLTTLRTADLLNSISHSTINGKEVDSVAKIQALVDTVAPTTPSISVIDDIGLRQGVVENGSFTDDTNPTIRVNFDSDVKAGDKIQLYNGSIIYTPYVLQNTDITKGYWEYTPSVALIDGSTYTFNATITDVAGNKSNKSTSYTIKIDTNESMSSMLQTWLENNDMQILNNSNLENIIAWTSQNETILKTTLPINNAIEENKIEFII